MSSASLPPVRLDRRFEVRTPESVIFSYREAGMYSRFLAWCIDGLVIAALALGGMIALGWLARLTFGIAQPLLYIYLFLVTSGYFVGCEWQRNGSSPGKRGMSLRVIRDDGLKLTFAQSVVRNLLRLVDSLPALYGTALAVAWLSRHDRRLGDHVAGTLVVAEEHQPVPKAVPAEATSALATEPGFFELVRRRTTVEERDLLLSAALRREELRLSARVEVFAAMSRHFARRLGVEKPAHLSDEKFVCAIAAALVS